MAQGKARPWTDDELRQLIELRQSGLSWDAIGSELGRTAGACQVAASTRARSLGYQPTGQRGTRRDDAPSPAPESRTRMPEPLPTGPSRLQRVLKCATPEEYWEWQGKPGSGPPTIVLNHDRRFCLDSTDVNWCRNEREEGRCCLTDGEFAYVEQALTSREENDDKEQPVTTTVSKTIAQRAAARRAAQTEPEPPAIEVPVTRLQQVADPLAASPASTERPRRAWRVWTASLRSLADTPRIGINRQADVHLSRAAVALLGNPMPEAVQILWEAESQTIGFRGALLHDPGARPFAERAHRDGTWRTGLKSFCETHNIDFSASRKFRAELEDGVLICCLGDQTTAVTHE